jgi:cytochrome c553
MSDKLGPGAPCPRCGLPIDFLEQRRTKSGQVYYIAWHYVYVNGQRTIKKCYLGPRTYRHGQVTHQNTGVELKGMIEDLQGMPRLSDYLRGVMKTLKQRMEDRTLSSVHAMAIAQTLEELASLIEPLRKYAEEKAKEEVAVDNETDTKAQPLEAPQVTTQPKTVETRQGDAYKMISTLTGMPPDEIERQLNKLKEALKELKASR